MGEMLVPQEALWGAQTERSHENFPIGTEHMPDEIVRAFAQLKAAAARANCRLGRMSRTDADLIGAVADEILAGKLDGNFPLVVWQTGSGTQSNMNVNEVIANRGNQIAGERRLHPNDSVNMSQSSNDTFPTAMHIAAVTAVREHLLPAVAQLTATFRRLEVENADVVKSGRTHLQDAVPISFAQEISGWRGLLEGSAEELEASLAGLYRLALGGTAVGTGLNAPEGFDRQVCALLTECTGTVFRPDPNKFHALTSHDALTFAHGALKALAANLMKIANDIRWEASGPRCGMGELHIPENEPGSSIMPGKVNPTQCEAVTMVAVQVFGNDAAIGFAASQGNFQLNVFQPVCAYNFLQSARLLGDVMDSFRLRCTDGITADEARMERNLHGSLMLVTCLTPKIGYEAAAAAAKKALREGTSLKEAVLALGLLSEAEFDAAVRPEKMV